MVAKVRHAFTHTYTLLSLNPLAPRGDMFTGSQCSTASVFKLHTPTPYHSHSSICKTQGCHTFCFLDQHKTVWQNAAPLCYHHPSYGKHLLHAPVADPLPCPSIPARPASGALCHHKACGRCKDRSGPCRLG